jgi:hypothetical protein
VKKGSSGSFANSGMNFGMLTWETFSAEYGNCIKGLPYALNIVQYLCPLDSHPATHRTITKVVPFPKIAFQLRFILFFQRSIKIRLPDTKLSRDFLLCKPGSRDTEESRGSDSVTELFCQFFFSACRVKYREVNYRDLSPVEICCGFRRTLPGWKGGWRRCCC